MRLGRVNALEGPVKNDMVGARRSSGCDFLCGFWRDRFSPMAMDHRVNRVRLSHDFSEHIVSLRPLFDNRRRLEMLSARGNRYRSFAFVKRVDVSFSNSLPPFRQPLFPQL